MATNVFLSNPFCSHPFASNVFTGVKVPVPPFVPTKKKAKAAVGGGSFLSPTEPLYSVPGCPPWSPPKGLLDKVFSKRNKRTAPDPLEVLRDVKKTEEKVKKSELRALRIRISKLTQESQGLEVSHQREIQTSFQKVRELEHRIVCLQQDLTRIESWYQTKLKWQPNPIFPKWQPSQTKPESLHAVQEAKAPEENLREDRSWQAIKSALPYAGVSGAVTLATIYLVPDENRTLKFVGYGSAMGALLIGVNVALDVLLEP